MSLPAGAKLGPFEILSKLGEGGMGDVYKARDSRLDRIVAIKIVRTDFSERFQREAKSISALNHPNICTLYDVGEQDGTAYLVMEFVDGAPLAGPLPLPDVIKYGVQMAEALDAAHRAGIVHRDLKPANVMATRSGIKLLDFGLAKLQSKASATDPIGNEATVAALTGAHTVIGTPQYMAPEQIEGREADARTDIFALGCVLYELVTGKRAFEGKTVSGAMAAVLATEPRKISEIVPLTPPALEWIVSRCLEKDPDARFQSARDVALLLKRVGAYPNEGTAAPAPQPAAPARKPLLIGIGLGAIAATLITAAVMTMGGDESPTSREVASLSISLPPDLFVADSPSNSSIAVSPDGRLVAFAGAEKEALAIYLRRLDSYETVKIAGTEGGEGPFFSPHGDWIGFFADHQIKKVPVGGGAAVPVTDAPTLRGAVWLDDDTIVYSPLPTAGLMRVSANGGTPSNLTTLDAKRQEKTHRTLFGLPGGKTVVFTVGSNEIGVYDEARIVALTLATGKITDLLTGGYAPAYSPTGHLLYVSKHRLFADRFDVKNLKLAGSPVQVLDDVASRPTGVADFSLSSTGTLAYATGGDRTLPVRLTWIDRKGALQPIQTEEREFSEPALSQDGHKLAMILGAANNSIWTYDFTRAQLTRVTFKFDVESPAWTPDGSISYWSGEDVRTIASDGSGKEEVLIDATTAAGRMLLPRGWSGDGQKLALVVVAPGQRPDVAVYQKSDKRIVPVAATRFAEFDPRISPDGKWLLYLSDESTRLEVYLRASDGSGPKYPVSSGGGTGAAFTKDGRELIYVTPKGVMASTLSGGSGGAPPAIGQPTRLFETNKPEFANIVDGNVDVSPDGERFIALLTKRPPPMKEIKVVTGWTEKLKK